MQGMRMKSHRAVFVTSRPQKQTNQNFGVSYGGNNVLPFRRPGTSNNPVVAEAKPVMTAKSSRNSSPMTSAAKRPAKTGRTKTATKKRTSR